MTVIRITSPSGRVLLPAVRGWGWCVGVLAVGPCVARQGRRTAAMVLRRLLVDGVVECALGFLGTFACGPGVGCAWALALDGSSPLVARPLGVRWEARLGPSPRVYPNTLCPPAGASPLCASDDADHGLPMGYELCPVVSRWPCSSECVGLPLTLCADILSMDDRAMGNYRVARCGNAIVEHNRHVTVLTSDFDRPLPWPEVEAGGEPPRKRARRDGWPAMGGLLSRGLATVARFCARLSTRCQKCALLASSAHPGAGDEDARPTAPASTFTGTGPTDQPSSRCT